MPKHKKQNQRQKQKRWEKQQQRNNKNNNNNYNKNNYNKNNNYDNNNNNSINNYNNKNNNNNKKYMSKKERNAYRKKKNRRKDEIDEEFVKDLEKLGYFIREVGGDGNCLFRSVSDQMDNTEKNHKLYREICIDYMKKNQDEFAPFIEDDETYDKYLERMGEDGEWGGNLEIYALSKALNANFYIYIHKHPMYIVNNFEEKHYNSLRKLEEKNNEDKEKEEKRKKEKLENGDDKDDNDEEEEEEDDDNEDINNLISKVDHLNI